MSSTEAIMRFSNLVHPTGGFFEKKNVVFIKEVDVLHNISEHLEIKGETDSDTFKLIVEQLQKNPAMVTKFSNYNG